jgi:methionyl-tRNA synthetase
VRKVLIIANLQPRKLKGIESNGKPVLAAFLEDIAVGARLK